LNQQISPAHFKLYRSGGQTLMSARRQREKCLETIVERYFNNFGIKVQKQPLLGDFTPDILIKKRNHSCYIELKAFHESYICGDPEISQAMKYFEYIKQNHASQENKDLNSETQKVILITSGTLKSPEDVFFNNPKMDTHQFISNYYKQKVLPRKRITTLDGLSARDIYRQASKKFKKQFANGFSPMRIIFLKEVDISYFPKYLFKVTNFDVLLISSDNFYQILKDANMDSLANKFDLLRRKTLEELIINGKILKI
jgi:translation initiation factor 1 (eIF-1/SUI1)